MKRILFLSLCLMAAMLSFAHDFEVDGIYYSITSSTAPYTVVVTYKGTSYSEYSNEYTGSVTIPEKVTYNGKTYSVTSIGWSAFRECSGLTSITIPNSVTSIWEDAFYGTAWYDNQPNGLVYAGKVAYKYKGAMPENTAIVLEEGTTEIASKAFYNCSGLTSITIPNSVTRIGMEAFRDCTGLTSIEIPNSVTVIGGEAFSGCTGLASVTIPNSVIHLGGTFSGCSGLTSVNIPNSVTVIDGRTFEDCSSLTSITIPSSVTIIGQFAFRGCSSLTSITIPNSVTSIGDYAFCNCSGLTSITIPNSVTAIGWGAFYSTAWYNNQPNGLVYAGKVAYKYKGTMPDNTAIVLEEGTTGIADIAFYNCSGLTSITIPNSVTSIGESAFQGCYSLTTATIGNNMRSIGWGAFRYCSGLTSMRSEGNHIIYTRAV